MENENQKKREFTRVKTALEVEVVAGGRTVVSAQTKDVSMNGVYVFTADKVPEDSPCTVTLFLGGRETGIEIQASGKTVRCDGSGFAVEFMEVQGLESYEHMKNLVLYNAGDARCVEAEFESHLGIRPK